MSEPEITSYYQDRTVARSVQSLQFGLQRLEIADGVLEGRVRTERLELHEVPADVVQAHVGEPTPGRGQRLLFRYSFTEIGQIKLNTAPTTGQLRNNGSLPIVGRDSAGVVHVSCEQHVDALHQVQWLL